MTPAERFVHDNLCLLAVWCVIVVAMFQQGVI